jgi:hypothetical protein
MKLLAVNIPMPISSSTMAARTIFQFSLIFGCCQHDLDGSNIPGEKFSWISESLSLDAVCKNSTEQILKQR